jgi:hypothetical protein
VASTRTALAARGPSEPLVCAGIGAAVAIAVALLAPPAQDLAGHVYRANLVDHGVILWDNFWYTGDYPLVSYSILAPALSALVGIVPLLVACTAAAGALFAMIAVREWGADAVWPSRAFAVGAALPLLPGLDAYVVGVPLALAALAALQRGRRWIALVVALLSLLASPLAFLFLLGAVLSIALAGRADRRTVAIVGGALLALAAGEALLMVFAFPTVGVYPFLLWHLIAIGALALAGVLAAYRDRATRPIALVLAFWAVASLASYLVPNPIGDNIARLRYAVFPLVLLVAVRSDRRRLAAVAALAALIYAAAPDLVQVSEQADASSAHAQAWAPILALLHRRLPVGARVEVVPTSARWEAYFLPSQGIPIARGWFRQTDLARNPLFYARSISPSSYRAWLARDAVQLVVLTPFPLDDHGASAEAALLRSGRSGLHVVRRQGGFTVYAATRRAELLTGRAGARVTAFTHERIAGTVRRKGLDTLRVKYSPYWTARGAARCVKRGPDGMSAVRFDRAGRFSLSITHDPFTIARRAADADADC